MALLARNIPAIKATGQQVRGMATEKQILMRIGATSNIAKITKSMKMVSAAKMRGAENRLNGGRPFSAWLENVGSKLRVFEKEGLIPQEELKEEGNNTFVIVSTDRGLCGGINSGIAKATRRQVGPIANESQLFIIGDKGRAQLRRDFGPSIRGNVTETYVNPPNFAVASAVAEAILASAPTEKKENLHILFNKFVSAIAYQPSIRSLKLNFTSEALSGYELETDSEDDLIADLKEFELASAIYHGIIENSTSEESSRMSAMENATSNAQELISSLTLQYNKARQARITTELIEIISGAASLEG